MSYSLAELADYLGLTFSGEAHREFTGLASLASAGPADVSYLRDEKYLPQLSATRAGAVILSTQHQAHCPCDCLLAQDPQLSFALATGLFESIPLTAAGVHPAAVIEAEAQVHAGAVVEANAVIEAGAVVEEGAQIGAGSFVGRNSRVGAGTRLYPQVVLYHDVSVGADCVLHSHAVIGADGFGFARSAEGWEKIHQLGGVRIGDRVEIGAATTVDRGALDDTVIEEGVIIDNQVQIGHNCRIGRNTAIAGCVGLAGSTIVGADCTLAGGVGVVGHVQICDNVHVTAMTLVTRSISEPGSYSSGTPMAESQKWKRSAVRFGQLDQLQRRLAALERAINNRDEDE